MSGPVCIKCELPAAAVDERGVCAGCRYVRPETAGESAQRYERQLRDGVLDEIVEWLAEEDRDTVLVRDVLEFIHTLRTRKRRFKS